MVQRKQDNTINALTHIIGLFFQLIGPFIILAVTTNKETKKHAKTILNWHFSIVLYTIIFLILWMVVISSGSGGAFTLIMSFLLLILIGILNIVSPIVAAIKAAQGQLWRYPLSMRFFKVKYS